MPCSVPFPALVSRRAFDAVLEPVDRDNGAFLDSRALRGADQETVRKQLAGSLGVPVRAPEPWDYADSYAAAARRQIMPPRAYLNELRKSRYFVLMRGTADSKTASGLIGQASIEAAACGCVVLSGHGAYPDRLCHKVGYIDPNSWASVADTIRLLEADTDLRLEILAHQERKLQECFLEQPMVLLEELVRVKRKALK